MMDSVQPPRDEASASPSPVSTYELLQTLGFVSDQWTSDGRPFNLQMDFGDFQISAVEGMNRHFRDVVAFHGFRWTNHRRTLHDIDFEMPRTVESCEQGIAWLTWCLDKQASVSRHPPLDPVSWLAEGRAHFPLLPWEQDRIRRERDAAEYAASPHCYADREWARLAFRHLDALIARANGQEPITFSYDGEILVIRCLDQILPIPAKGKPWAGRFSLSASAWHYPNRRFKHREVTVGIFKGALAIDTHQYPGAVPLDTEES